MKSESKGIEIAVLGATLEALIEETRVEVHPITPGILS
jgi:hypothetical protein